MASKTDQFSIQNAARDNDYFTSTIVGLPSEVILGKAFTERKLAATPTIIIRATTSETWLSDPARQLLKQHIKPTPKTLGLPFATGNFAQTKIKNSSTLGFLIAFALGFSLCAALSYFLMSSQ